MDSTPHDWPLEIDGELRITTPSSIWLIRPAVYVRLPRHAEQPRSVPSEALTDGDWHEHVGAWWFIDPLDGLVHIRLLPAGRPDGARGIHTGVVEIVEASTARLPARRAGCSSDG